MEPRLIQNQTQKLVLSPQIRQYLRLLQLPMPDLQQAVEIELSENPVLEETRHRDDQANDNPEDSDFSAQEKNMSEIQLGETFDNLNRLDDQFRENFSINATSSASIEDLQKSKDFQETSLTKTESLAEALIKQLSFFDLTGSDLMIAEEIIGNMNEHGYVSVNLDEIAHNLEISEDEVLGVLQTIQQCEPAGIGARDLQECLLLQLQRGKKETTLAYKIIEHSLGLLEKRNWSQIAKTLGVSKEEVKLAAETITSLDPHPGRIFQTHQSTHITPDATISFVDDDSDELLIEVHDEMIPELRISRYYRRLLHLQTTDTVTKAFLKEKLQAALNFIRAISLRKSTIRQITEVIAKAQPEFFEKGFSHLKPLRLKDVADQIGMHESTVSRALQGKYIETPQGVIPYKEFFSNRMETTSGEDESQKSIMEQIKKLIESENPEKPLSDQALVAKLKENGIKIARRTVAKYRDLLRILPSHLRREK